MLFLILWICFWFLSLASSYFVRNSYYLPSFLIKWISKSLLPFGTILILKYDCFLSIFQFRHSSQMFHSLHSLLSFSTSTSAAAYKRTVPRDYLLSISLWFCCSPIKGVQWWTAARVTCFELISLWGSRTGFIGGVTWAQKDPFVQGPCAWFNVLLPLCWKFLIILDKGSHVFIFHGAPHSVRWLPTLFTNSPNYVKHIELHTCVWLLHSSLFFKKIFIYLFGCAWS